MTTETGQGIVLIVIREALRLAFNPGKYGEWAALSNRLTESLSSRLSDASQFEQIEWDWSVPSPGYVVTKYRTEHVCRCGSEAVLYSLQFNTVKLSTGNMTLFGDRARMYYVSTT